MRWISTLRRRIGVFIQAFTRTGISELMSVMDTAAEIGPPQLSARRTSRSKRSIVMMVNAEISFLLWIELEKKMLLISGYESITTFLVAVKKKGCVGLSYVRGDPTTWHSLSMFRSMLQVLLVFMFFLSLLSSSSSEKWVSINWIGEGILCTSNCVDVNAGVVWIQRNVWKWLVWRNYVALGLGIVVGDVEDSWEVRVPYIQQELLFDVLSGDDNCWRFPGRLCVQPVSGEYCSRIPNGIIFINGMLRT